ncbi:hypothetical protein K439DRAFT_1511326 [Ramaria rubella]|nr:hypothetical protein K439DRAFT_1511326 [Ramaria rubella]
MTAGNSPACICLTQSTCHNYLSYFMVVDVRIQTFVGCPGVTLSPAGFLQRDTRDLEAFGFQSFSAARSQGLNPDPSIRNPPVPQHKGCPRTARLTSAIEGSECGGGCVEKQDTTIGAAMMFIERDKMTKNASTERIVTQLEVGSA